MKRKYKLDSGRYNKRIANAVLLSGVECEAIVTEAMKDIVAIAKERLSIANAGRMNTAIDKADVDSNCATSSCEGKGTTLMSTVPRSDV